MTASRRPDAAHIANLMSTEDTPVEFELQSPPKEAPLSDNRLVERIVEAAVLASTQPMTVAQLYALFPEDQPAPRGSVEQAIEALQAACAERGVMLVEVASGFRFQVQRDVQPWVSRMFAERPQRYTRATLETLALIAYRQPITRGEIEAIRGVAVSPNIIKMLEEREWIRVVGHRDVPGRPALFGTTKLFLDYFNLKSLDELPPLSEIRDLGELEPQLPFEEPLPVQALAAAMPEADSVPVVDDAGDDGSTIDTTDVVTTSDPTPDESDSAASDRTP
jgi:segregation and condensation protein B